MKDYYELLEVSRNASEDTIKKVFRILIKKNHPDLFEGKEKQKAEERVKLLNEAYAILSDKGKREKYNLELEEKNSNQNTIIETLAKENEYLKSVINEKNAIINEFYEQTGVEIEQTVDDSEYNYQKNFYTEKEMQDDRIQQEAFKLYRDKEMLRKITYMSLMILFGSILLRIITGISVFRIFIQVFKNMF